MMLAYVQYLHHDKKGLFDGDEEFTKLLKVSDDPNSTRQVIQVKHIWGAAHLIPIPPQPNSPRSYFLNSRIDIRTYNYIDSELPITGRPPARAILRT